MNASRFALAGLSLGTILVALLPTTNPPSPVKDRRENNVPLPSRERFGTRGSRHVKQGSDSSADPEQGPMSGPGQPARGSSGLEPRPASSDRVRHSAEVAPAKGAPNERLGALDPPDAAAVTCPRREAETIAWAGQGQPRQQPTGHLRLAEARLKQMLASWRESSNGYASRTGNVLQQPSLDDLAGLMPEARLDELAKLVSYRHLDRDQLRVASAPAPRPSPVPGLIVPVSYDSAPLASRADLGRAPDVAAPDSRPRERPRTLPGLAPLTRWHVALSDWIAQRVRPLLGRPDRRPARPPAPLPGHVQQP